MLASTGKSSEAEAEYRKALAIQQKLAHDNPAVTGFRDVLAFSHHNLGGLLHRMGKSSEAEAEYRKALAIQQKLDNDDPANIHYRGRLAISHQNLGSLLKDRGKSSEAEAEYRKALAIGQKLADDDPAHADFRNRLATNHNDLASLWSKTGKSWEAVAEYRKALAIYQKLADDNPAPRSFTGIWQTAWTTSVGGSGRPEKRARRSVITRGKRRSGRSLLRPTRQRPPTRAPWRTARPTWRTHSVDQEGLTRRSPPASAPWRCVILWLTHIPSRRPTAQASARLTCESGRCDAT